MAFFGLYSRMKPRRCSAGAQKCSARHGLFLLLCPIAANLGRHISVWAPCCPCQESRSSPVPFRCRNRREGKNKGAPAVISTIAGWTGSAQGDMKALVLPFPVFRTSLAVLSGKAICWQTPRNRPALIFEPCGKNWHREGSQGTVADRRSGLTWTSCFLSVLHRLMVCRFEDLRRVAQGLPDPGVEGSRSITSTGQWFAGRRDRRAKRCHPFRPVLSRTWWRTMVPRGNATFSWLDWWFFDTTSLYFEGRGGESLGQKGFSKDHRPDLINGGGPVLDSREGLAVNVARQYHD